MPQAIPKPAPANPWQGFRTGAWQERANVEEFILGNYTPYLGDDSGLTGPAERTQALWMQAQMLQQAESASASRPHATPQARRPDYLDRREELIFGLPSHHPAAGLPSALDCRAVALYGAARLRLTDASATLEATVSLARRYGFDIEHPAATASQALQWTYFALLAAHDTGRTAHTYPGLDTFLDIYLQRDLERGLLIEEEAQELIDDLVIKLRLVSRLRATEGHSALHLPVAGTAADGRTLVTRTSFRLLNTLYTLGPAADPQFLVLWSTDLPAGFRQFCVEVTIDSSALRYGCESLKRAARSYTPESLGFSRSEKTLQMTGILDALPDDAVVGVNVFRREALEAALARPNHYTCLTVQLAEHAVDLQSLTPPERKNILHQLLKASQELPVGG